jgi:hypothetical protein
MLRLGLGDGERRQSQKREGVRPREPIRQLLLNLNRVVATIS